MKESMADVKADSDEMLKIVQVNNLVRDEFRELANWLKSINALFDSGVFSSYSVVEVKGHKTLQFNLSLEAKTENRLASQFLTIIRHMVALVCDAHIKIRHVRKEVPHRASVWWLMKEFCQVFDASVTYGALRRMKRRLISFALPWLVDQYLLKQSRNGTALQTESFRVALPYGLRFMLFGKASYRNISDGKNQFSVKARKVLDDYRLVHAAVYSLKDALSDLKKLCPNFQRIQLQNLKGKKGEYSAALDEEFKRVREVSKKTFSQFDPIPSPPKD